MPADDAVPFAEPLAELPLRGDAADPRLLILRLTERALILVPAPAPPAAPAAGGEETAGLEAAPPPLRWLLGKLVQLGTTGLDAAFKPHPLRDTEVILAGPYLHLRLGPFDAEYGPGSFDPAAAAAFIRRYEDTKREAL